MTPTVNPLALAQQLAARGQFPLFLQACQRIADDAGGNAVLLQNLGALYAAHGFIGRARACYAQVRELQPGDVGVLANVANAARDAGSHAQARRMYAELLERLPNHPVVRRNYLVGLEYDPDVPDAERLAAARAWGQWATARAGGPHARPAVAAGQAGRPLRVGYVGADFCQHTVGLFVKDVLAAHDPQRVQAFAYSAGTVNDWVTNAVRQVCTFRHVALLDDAALVRQVQADGIDVLVDLSGHTAGSRLTAFAWRPAPVQVSWLGYFATTGLEAMDAVLLDAWHAPSGAEAQFVEALVRLPQGRFCYQPVPWAPESVALSPCVHTGVVTFGSFNNTAKLNPQVLELWARVLAAVPKSRLVLKWRTFNDEAFRAQVVDAFVQRGIEAGRIELRGPGFHADVLKEYADIDIALDTFPFTGGLTSCEALWMGVPVVTWPQARVVSRQTHAFLHQIGLPELSASGAEDYVRIAVGLAGDLPRLASLRADMRRRMLASPLMNVSAFTRGLEDTFHELYLRITARRCQS